MNNNNKNYKYNNFNSFKEYLKDIKKLYIKNIKIIFLNLHNKTQIVLQYTVILNLIMYLWRHKNEI